MKNIYLEIISSCLGTKYIRYDLLLTYHVSFGSEQYIDVFVIKLNMRTKAFIHLLKHSPYLHKNMSYLKIVVISVSTVNKMS